MAKYTKYNATRNLYYKNNREKILKKKLELREANRDKYRKQAREWRQKRYLEVIALLGGKCVRCGFDDWRALEINHKDGCPRIENGNRKDWDYLKKDYDLSLVELLCGNCHNIETWGKQKDLYGKN